MPETQFLCPVCWGNDLQNVLTDNGDRTFTCPVCGEVIAFNDLSGKYDALMQRQVQHISESVQKRLAISRQLTASYTLYQAESQAE